MKCKLIYKKFVDDSVKFVGCNLNISSALEMATLETALNRLKESPNKELSERSINMLHDLYGLNPHNYEKTYIVD